MKEKAFRERLKAIGDQETLRPENIYMSYMKKFDSKRVNTVEIFLKIFSKLITLIVWSSITI